MRSSMMSTVNHLWVWISTLNQSHSRRLNFERFWKETYSCFLMAAECISTVITPKLMIIHTYESQSNMTSCEVTFIWRPTSMSMFKMVYFHNTPTGNTMFIFAHVQLQVIFLYAWIIQITISHNALWTWTSKSHWTVNKWMKPCQMVSQWHYPICILYIFAKCYLLLIWYCTAINQVINNM